MHSFFNRFIVKRNFFKETQSFYSWTFRPSFVPPIRHNHLQINNFSIKSQSLLCRNSTLFNSQSQKPVGSNFSKVRSFVNESGAAKPNQPKTEAVNLSQTEPSMNIFKKFKLAYKQHGKVLIFVHIFSSVGWIVAFFILSNSGVDITKVLDGFEKINIISDETRELILSKIENFNLERFLRNYRFDFVLNEAMITRIGELITGNTLKNILSAIMLYKLFTPFRYLFTLSMTRLVIGVFKRQGIIPKQPPPGTSVKELYTEQKIKFQRRLLNQRERYEKSKIRMFSKNFMPKRNEKRQKNLK